MANLNSQETLRKARYFIEQARVAEVNPEVLNNRLPFAANLEAAIVYARSSIDHLNAEMKATHKTKGYGRWHDKRWSELRTSNGLVDCLAERRNFIIHQGPADTSAHVSVETEISLALSVSVEVVVTRVDGTVERRESEPSTEIPRANKSHSSRTSQTFYFSDPIWSEKPAIDYVDEFIGECEKFILEAERKFL